MVLLGSLAACGAAAGLGLALELDIRKDAESFGIIFAQAPVVLLNGQMVLRGLPRTRRQ